MLVMGQRVRDDIAGRIARTDGRHLEIEIDPFLRDEPALAELPPGSFEVCLEDAATRALPPAESQLL